MFGINFSVFADDQDVEHTHEDEYEDGCVNDLDDDMDGDVDGDDEDCAGVLLEADSDDGFLGGNMSAYLVWGVGLALINSKDYGAYASKKLGSVPVNFLSDLDITNGNSGSATINKNFELVGLAFDGMLETIISDYSFVPQARTISVDSRYLLWTLDKVENAENILEEITIVN